MKNNSVYFGIMQGRLSQKVNAPLQSFPNNTWEKEFIRARKIGFKRIEWLIDIENNSNNPLFSRNGRQKIIEISNTNDIEINTLCCHFLITGKILKENPESESIRNIFYETIKYAPLIGVRYISIPLIEEMSLNKKDVFNEMKNFIEEIINDLKIEILIESDLRNYALLNFIESIGSDKIGILYDVGNATKNNFVFKREFPLIKENVKEIHIKDFSIKANKSVRLGKGNTDLKDIYKTIKKYNWEGPIILETPTIKDWRKEATFNFNHINDIFQN